MKNITSLAFFIVLFTAYAYADFAALEIKETDFPKIADYIIEYNLDKTNSTGWTPLLMHCGVMDGTSVQNLYGDVFLSSNTQKMYLRLRNTDRRTKTDAYGVDIRDKCTNFLTIDLIEGCPTSDFHECPASHDNRLTYYDIKFKEKPYQNENNYITLNYPPRNFRVYENAIHFSWSFNTNIYLTNISSSFLIIGSKDDSTIYNQINTFNTNSYYLPISPNDYELYKEYWWQVVFEDNNNNLIGSEIRPFYIVDESGEINDSDNDGYCDNLEITRGSDYMDPQNFPLIISAVNLPKSRINMQYLFYFSSNFDDSSVRWLFRGSLPSGLKLSDRGVLSGRPTEIGVYNFIVVATDSHEMYDEISISFVVDDSLKSEIIYE